MSGHEEWELYTEHQKAEIMRLRERVAELERECHDRQGAEDSLTEWVEHAESKCDRLRAVAKAAAVFSAELPATDVKAWEALQTAFFKLRPGDFNNAKEK